MTRGELPTRPIGLRSATALVVANTIGTGVFTTSGFALADLASPTWVLVAWVVGGLIAASGALCYAALARELRESGGEYLFLARGFHPAAGFVAGWVSFFVGFTAPVAASALALMVYLNSTTGLDLPAGPGAALVIVVTTLIHARAFHWGLRLQDLAVGLKLLALAATGIFGLWLLPQASTDAPATAAFRPLAFASSLIWIGFAYSGWNAAVYVAAEVKDGARTVGRALVLGTAIVAVVYVVLNAVFVHAAPWPELAGRADVAVVATRALGGETFARITGVIVSLALLTSISAMTIAGPRVYAKMADDGLLPRALAARGNPRLAIVLQSSCAVLLVLASNLREILGWIGFTLGLATAASVLVLVRLRLRQGPSLPVFGWPYVPLFFCVATMAASVAAAFRETRIAVAGALVILSGLVVYALRRR